MKLFRKDHKPSKEPEAPQVESAEEKAKKFVEDGQAAQKLVSKYGGVLEITSKMTYGAPQSLLPRPKHEIKQAIMTYLYFLQLTKEGLNKSVELWS